tara:strand:- start:50 stop:259 length:210 start_codon:yes stop_codon:yes gene_type:complete
MINREENKLNQRQSAFGYKLDKCRIIREYDGYELMEPIIMATYDLKKFALNIFRGNGKTLGEHIKKGEL